MRRASKKRAALLRVYTKRRRAFLESHPRCARCCQLATEVHHMAGRWGAALLDESRWLSLCHACHKWVTEHPLAAVEQGFSLPRVGRAS